MKKIILATFVLCSLRLSAQIPQDTGALRTKINTDIQPNGTKQITATQVNHILNGIASLMKAYSVDSAYRIEDTLFLTRRGGFTTIKVTLATGGVSSETDPTVPTVAKSLTPSDITNWNGKQNAITPSTGISLIANVISAQNTTALWNANSLQGNPVSSTTPLTGQILKWNGTAWAPAADGGGAGSDNNNIGSFFRLLLPGTQEIKNIAPSWGINWDSTSNANALTGKIDSAAVPTMLRRNKGLDSLRWAMREELIDSLDKVTQARHPIDVIPGANNSIPDTLILTYDDLLDTTADGELTVDTFAIATRPWHNKGMDSIASTLRSEFPSVNPGVYFSPAQFANPAFVVFASAIVRPTNSFSHGAAMTWEIINYTSDHNSSFFDSVYGDNGSQRLFVRYPTAKYVLNGVANPDEVFAQHNIVSGASVGVTLMQIAAYRNQQVGFRLTGNGAGTWTVSSAFPSLITASTYNTSTGFTGFNLTSTWGIDYNSVNIQYIGPNNYRIRRQYTSLGIYNVGFILIDEFNNPVTIAPSTSDEIIITNAGTQPIQTWLSTWANNNNSFLSSASNFWVTGIFECWLVAAATSSTSIQVRWQTDYPSATDYKIYRSSTGLYGTYTLIATGTSGSAVDTGLTPGSTYTYKMVAVVGGVDTDVTTFNASTKL